jgi:hypothetical protein
MTSEEKLISLRFRGHFFAVPRHNSTQPDLTNTLLYEKFLNRLSVTGFFDLA